MCPPSLALDPAFCALLSGSYVRLVGQPLIPPACSGEQAARWLYEEAPYCVLVHNLDPDPRFIYANAQALACFEYSWEEMTALPSRLSAEAPDRAERQRLLDAVARHGFATGYRVAKSERRFWIEDTTVWRPVDRDGVLHGQAAIYRRWRNA